MYVNIIIYIRAVVKAFSVRALTLPNDAQKAGVICVPGQCLHRKRDEYSLTVWTTLTLHISLFPLHRILHYVHELQQVLHAEIATPCRHSYERIRRRKIGKCFRDIDKASPRIVETDALTVWGPKVPLQFEALSKERVERMSDSKTSGFCVNNGCSWWYRS